MKTEFSTPLESWLVLALIAILSAPIFGVVVSGCVKKEEVMLSDLAKSAGSFGESSRPQTAEDRYPAPKRLLVKKEAPSTEAKASAGADKAASQSKDEFAEGGGKETASDSRSEGEKVKNPEASPALQSARRLLKIFEATEEALSGSEDDIDANQGSKEGK